MKGQAAYGYLGEHTCGDSKTVYTKSTPCSGWKTNKANCLDHCRANDLPTLDCPVVDKCLYAVLTGDRCDLAN